MPIPERFIDELVARSELSGVVGEYVHLTPKGGSLWGSPSTMGPFSSSTFRQVRPA